MTDLRWKVISEDELYHFGIKGQKWGIRRFQNADGSLTSEGKRRYSSTSVGAKIARMKNRKVDEGFRKWKEGSANRENAINLGKKANASRLAYEASKTRETKEAYKNDKREYKKALRENTTYRKGQVRSEVGQDISRKYLSKAKQIEKELKKDPTNRELQREYNRLMSKHDIERAKARRAPEVAARRSQYKANIKRSMTVSAKAAVASAATYAGYKLINKYLNEHDVRMNGKRVTLDMNNIETFKNIIRLAKKAMGYF